MTDSDPDVRWMSYAEAAKALGVNPESVARRMRRGNWARGKGNDGRPRVAVPVSALPALPVVRDNVPDSVPDIASSVPDNTDIESRTIKALEGEAATLREALTRERERVDNAEIEAAAERARAAQAEREREAARVAVAAAEGEAKELREIRALERDRADRAEDEAAILCEQVKAERERAAAAEAEREKARMGRAAAEAGLVGLREALAEARRPFWRRWLGVAALCAGSTFLPAIASAQVDPESATWAMPGCRAAIYESHIRRLTVDESLLAGMCLGVVRGLLGADPGVCTPNGSTQGQAMRVVVQYIDARPARQHENFADLALEALRSAWPCRR